MKFYKPKFWDKKSRPNFIALLLSPLSIIALIRNYYENSKIKKTIMISGQFALVIFILVEQVKPH